MSQERKIIINGDDFGYSLSVNKGIILAYREGILTTTTVMANLLKGDESLKDLGNPKVAKPPLGVGVHLNLTNGVPLSGTWPEQGLNRPFKGQNVPEEWKGSAWREYITKFPVDIIEAEYDAQIKRVQQVFGQLDHLDSHHSSASYSPADEAYFKMAILNNLPVRPLAPHTENPQYGGDMVVNPDFYNDARRRGIRTVDSVDLRYLDKESFYRALDAVKPGEVVEFMFHPAVDVSQGEWRVKDLELLTSGETIERVKRLGIQLTTYQESSY